MEISPAVPPSLDASSSASGGSESSTSETNAPGPAKYDEEDEEEDVCRICRNPGDADNPLRYPCACSGSIKFVHQECLLQWLDHSNNRQCEVCFYHPLVIILYFLTNLSLRMDVNFDLYDVVRGGIVPKLRWKSHRGGQRKILTWRHF